MASKINYNTKAPFQTREDIPDENKVNAEDMNEIKTVVNNNADELNTAKEDIEGLQNGQGTASTDITSLKNRVSTLETDNSTNKTDINNLKTDNETNKSNIQTLQQDNETNKKDIVNLEENKVDKVEGKGLSTEDFTTELKEKLEGLKNYDDTEIKEDISNLEAGQTEQDKQIDMLINALPTETQEAENINIKGTIPVKFKEFAVGGNSKQETREGYNLLNYNSLESTTINGVAFTINDDKSITANGTATANATFNLIGGPGVYPLELEEGDYTLNGCEGGSSSTYSMEIYDGTTYRACQNGKTTFNTTGTSIRFYISVKSGVTVNNVTFYPMLVKGTEEKEYESYGAMPSPEYKSDIQTVEGNANVAVCSKNIAKIDTINKRATRNGVTITIDDDGIITLNGTATANMYVNVLNITDISGANMENYNLPKRNYKAYFELIAKNNSQISEGNGDLQFYFRNRAVSTEEIKSFSYAQFIRIIQGNTGVTVKDMQITENTIVSYAYIPVGVVLDNLKFRFAIFNENETDTTYVKHEEENYILPVQEELLEGDYFVKEADGWKEVHTWNKKILNGIENWVLNSVYPSVFYLDNLDNIDTDRNDYELKCDTYKYVAPISTSANAQNNTIFGFLQNSTTLFSRITIKDERFTTVSDFKNNLESKNVIAYYKNAIPTKLPCTEEQIAVLEQLNNAKSYEDSTNVYSTNEVSPIFKVTAIKDINSVITQLNQLILENGGN